MNRISMSAVATALMVLGATIGAPYAAADPIGRSVRTPSKAVSSPGRSLRSSNAGLSAVNRNRGGNALSRNNRSAGNGLVNPYNGNGLGILADAFRESQYDRYYRDSQKETAKAYRDAAIATAAIGVVGTIIGSAIAADQHRAAPPVAHCPPAGRYVTERVLVREGYNQEQRVWVPEYRDPATGALIRGHYETHVQWVPPVYEERQVWVPYR